jgi:hypothetical protein
VVGTIDLQAGSIQLYVNGSLAGSAGGILGEAINTRALTFGAQSGGGAFFNGLIDDIRVYNRALSAAEVSSLYLRGGGWQYRRKITIGSTNVAGPLTDFPVLISLIDPGLTTKAQASGNDILFTAVDGTKLSHEIEKYDPGTGTLVAWVKVPSLSATANTDVYMYYGDAGASDQQNKTGVWTNGYVGVWHLKEEQAGTGTVDVYKDSTANADHGDDFISAIGQTGKINGGHDFNGTSDYVALANDPVGNLTNGTVSAWVRFDSVTWSNDGTGVWAYQTSHTAGSQNAILGAHPPSWGNSNLGFGVWAGGAWRNAQATTAPATGTWYHMVGTWGTGGVQFYLDGAWKETDSSYTGAMPDTTVHTIGRTARVDGLIDGLIDEVRISNVARSAAWIQTEYNNQNSPATFYSVGAEEVLGGGGTVIGGDQSGRVYSVDTAAGVTNWTAVLTGATAIQAGVSAQVRSWSSPTFQAAYSDNVIFAATLNTSSATNNKVFALKASNGTLAWPTLFNLNGTDYSVDTIAGQPYVDYVNDRLYVASKAGSSGTQQSLWVIKTVDGEAVLKGQPVSPCTACTVTGRHFDTSPTLSWDGATLYLGAMDGTLYAINTSGLTPQWNLPLGAGANIKTAAFVWEDYSIPGRLYFTTADGNVRCVQDNGGSGSACAGWTVTNVPGASTPLLLGKLFVGSSNGTVYQIDPATGLTDKQFPAAGTLDGTSKLGAISTETGGEIFVGTDGGKIFKITLTSGALP